jgi:hypothetical protein
MRTEQIKGIMDMTPEESTDFTFMRLWIGAKEPSREPEQSVPANQ